MESRLSSDYRVLIVGHLYPAELEAKILDQPMSPIQTQRFGLALLDSLRAGLDDKIDVLSSALLLNFPHSRFVFAPSAKWRIDNIIPVTMVSFVNLVIFKHITRFAATLFFVFRWVLRNRKYNRVIILHGVHSCKIWGVLLGQLLAPCIIIPFLTDDLGIPIKWESIFLKKMRLLDVYLMKLGLQRVSGIIAMTSKLAKKLAPGRPSLIVPAIWNSSLAPVTKKNLNNSDGTFTIVYAGGLFHNYGVELLLDAFERASRPDWRLRIAGAGELENTIRDRATHNIRIQFLGFLDSEGINNLYQSADVLVNPRPISTSIAGLSFPSKIVEYLGTGKPVVSTNLPAFDDNFRQHLIIARSDSPEELIRCIDEVSSWEDHQREAWRVKTIKFVQEELSPAVQGARIRSFIDRLKNLDIEGGK